MDYAKRQQIETYRPLIDDALLRIVETTGGDREEGTAALQAIDHKEGPWGYLNKAVQAVRPAINMETIDEVLPHNWVTGFLKGRWENAEIPFSYVETADQVEPGTFMRPLILEYYPEESHECLKQRTYVGGGDADIIALWRRDDRTSVCHAHMEGFWILGEDPTDFIEKYAAKLHDAVDTAG